MSNKCSRCSSTELVIGKKKCANCLLKQSIQQKQYREDRKKNGLCSQCGKENKSSKAKCQSCRDYTKQWNAAKSHDYHSAVGKKSADGLRKQVIEHYGSICACCGESEFVFMCIDHIDGNGADHRRELSGLNRGGSRSVYTWLKKHNYPAGFQVLCWNCNWAKSHGGCPHQKRTV